jgi:hypothetical protein
MPVSKSNAMCYPKNKYHAPVQSIFPLIPSLGQLTFFNEHVSYLSPSNPFHPLHPQPHTHSYPVPTPSNNSSPPPYSNTLPQ